ncbi:PHP domain-containing protein, partial [Bacteroides ovatus]|uniref:PHP domain-containing protein n=1 Tax=Bacteroides ovatus TaxID=28116 RepID=UPI00207A6739
IFCKFTLLEPYKQLYYNILIYRTPLKFNILKYIGKRTPCKVSVPFVNLGVHTSYELLNGSGELSDWVKKAKYLGQNAIGICDRNTMAATLNLQKECTKAGLKYVFGYSFTLEHEGNKVDMKIYCQSQKGLRNLLRIQKEIMVDSPTNTLTLSGLLTHAEGNVLVFGKLASYWMKKNSQILYAMNIAFDIWGIERSVFSMVGKNGRKVLKTKGFRHDRENGLNISKRLFSLHGLTSALRLRGFSSDIRGIALHRACRWG